MTWLERKGPFVSYTEEACPKCNSNLITFEIPVSDIIITETFCEGANCDYKITNSVDVIGDNPNEMSKV